MKQCYWKKYKRHLPVIGSLLVFMTVALQFWYAPCVLQASASTANRFAYDNSDETTRQPPINITPVHHLDNSSWYSSTPLPAISIDILSIGSFSRPDYLQAQRETMGRYARSFTGVTEDDDHSEPRCSLTRQDAQHIAQHCKIDRSFMSNLELDQPYSALYLRRQAYAKWGSFLSKRDNPGGWLCAQKRPNDGLQIVLQRLRNTTLPDYLLLIDDDAFVDLPQLTHYLQKVHPDSTKPLVMAGCLLRPQESFTFPFGGFGTFLSKGALTRLLTPISCNNVTIAAFHDEDDFIQNACYRLRQNLFGEQQYFQEQMTLADLMHAYVATHRFADHASWTKESSYCVHSDWIWGYFFNYYYVGEALNHPTYPQSHNRMTSYRLSEQLAKKWGISTHQSKELLGQCQYGKSCPPEAHMCHYVTAEQIRQKGQQVFTETKWVLPFDVSQQQPVPVFLYPILDHTIEHELKHVLFDGIQSSSQLALTHDYNVAPVWMVDVRRAGLSSKACCNRFLRLVRSVNYQKRIVIFVYWDDDPVEYFWGCYRATRLLDSTTVFRYKRSIVQGRQWNETLQFVEPGSIIKFGNWRDHSGGPVRHIGHGVRSDVVEGIESILNGASLWEVERPVDVCQFWSLSGQGDKEIHRGKASQLRDAVSRVVHKRLQRVISHFWRLPTRNDKLRDAVSQVIHTRLSETQAVFVGVAGQAHEAGHSTAWSAYLRQLLQCKIVVISQKDNLEDHYRIMEALVSGAMVLTDPMLTLPNELQENASIVYYRGLDELVTKAQYFLEHEDERITIAKAGYDIAMNHHRSWHLVERMVSEVRSGLIE